MDCHKIILDPQHVHRGWLARGVPTLLTAAAASTTSLLLFRTTTISKKPDEVQPTFVFASFPFRHFPASTLDLVLDHPLIPYTPSKASTPVCAVPCLAGQLQDGARLCRHQPEYATVILGLRQCEHNLGRTGEL
jgi:hypothetical protein